MSSTPATPNPTPSKLYGLDHLRALAISFVFIYHYGRMFPSPEWFSTLGKFGWTGVDLFFVLSGFLISSQLFADISKDKKISFKKFFFKRFFRIIPAYLAVVAIYFCIPSARERSTPAPLWKYLSFTQNLGLDLRTQGTFSHAWSLCIEEQFYLLLPLILMALVYFKLVKKSYWLLVGLFIAGFIIRCYIYETKVAPFSEEEGNWANWYKWIYYPTYSRLDGLLSGVTIAAVFQFRPALKKWLTSYGNFFLLLSIFVLTGAYFVCLNEESFDASVVGFFLVSVGYGLLVLGAVSPTSFLYKFKSVVSSRIAALSYALYLSHKIVIHITQQQFTKLHIAANNGWMLIICIITCLAAAWLMNMIIEKPFLRVREKVLAHIKS